MSATKDASNVYLEKNLRSLVDLQNVVQASATELAQVLKGLGAVNINGTVVPES